MKKALLLSMVVFAVVGCSQEEKEKKAVHTFAETVSSYIRASDEMGDRIQRSSTPADVLAIMQEMSAKTRDIAEGKNGCKVLPDEALKRDCISIFTDFANAYSGVKTIDENSMMNFFTEVIMVAVRMENFGNELKNKYPNYVDVRSDGIYPIN